MEEQKIYKFPILTINKVQPLLSKDSRVFSYSIKATAKNGNTVNLYTNNGFDLSSYVGQKMECLLEITKGEFEYKDGNIKMPENIFVFKYHWLKRLSEYFPELNKIKETLDEAYEEEENSIQELFERQATDLFQNWGLNGLNIGIYQAKPLLSSADGFFLLNEYQFEEEIESLELNDEVYIQIDEIYLRGVRPLVSSQDPKQKKVIPQPQLKPEPIPPIPKEEIPGKKKGRFDSLLELD